jgi:iron complex transport system ATP-binding protein
MIRVENITVSKGQNTIVKEVSFNIRPGRVSVVIGKNGAGKSTLLETLTGGNSIKSGSIKWDGDLMQNLDGKTLAIRRAVLSQQVTMSFSMPVKDLVEMGTYVSDESLPKIKIEHLVENALSEVGMEEFKNRDFNSLSGGEQKRVLLAKCIVQLNCCCWSNVNKYLFLDEPTSSLDIEQQYKFIALVKRLVRRRNIGVFAVLHDINQAAQFADDILMIRNGRIIEKGFPKDVLTPEKLRKTFDVTAVVNRHPVYDCPLITTLPLNLNQVSNF